MYFDTNTPIGWLHMYVAHLISACGVPFNKRSILKSVQASTARINAVLNKQASSNTLSDNECIMMSNRWLYYWNYEFSYWSVVDHNKTIEFEINMAVVHALIRR